MDWVVRCPLPPPGRGEKGEHTTWMKKGGERGHWVGGAEDWGGKMGSSKNTLPNGALQSKDWRVVNMLHGLKK